MREDKNIWGFHWEEMNRMFQEASGGTGRSLFPVDFNWMEEIIKTSLDKAFSENHDLQKSYSSRNNIIFQSKMTRWSYKCRHRKIPM